MRLRSIEHKIFLLILPVCLIPPVILMALLGWGSRLTFEKTLGSELSSRAEYLAGMFDQFVAGKVERLRTLGQAPAPDARSLAAAAAREAGASGVVIVTPAHPGEPVAALATPDDKTARWIAEAPYFHPFTQSRLQIPAPGLYQDLEIPIPARVAPLPLFVFAVENPAHERLFFFYDAAALVGAFRRSLPQHPEEFHIYSSSGFVPYAFEAADPLLTTRIREAMTTPHPGDRWFALKSGDDTFLVSPADSKLMTHARMLSGQGAIWSVLLTYDMEYFLSPLNEYIWKSILIILGLVLATLLLGNLAARHILRPLLALKLQSERISQGDLSARAKVVTGDEIGELAESFNTMAAHLRESYQALVERLADNQLRANHIVLINEITSAIVQALSLDKIFTVLIREMGKLAPCDAIWIALLSERGTELKVTQIHPPGLGALFDQGRIPLSGSIHGHAIGSQETVHAEIAHHELSGFSEPRILREQGFQSYLIAPLPSRDRIIGTLTVASTAPDAFNTSLAAIIGSLAASVAIAIEQAAMFERISNSAIELEQKVDERTRELERANRKLIQTEKYFATGRMAGNLAHEINNPLGIIKNYLRLVENGLRAAAERGEPAADLGHFQIINEEIDRIARLVHQMLNLHRPEEAAVKPIDVNALLDEILALMEQDLKHQRIRVARDLAPELPRPLGSPDLARQLLINLLRNAQDAMEGGGTLAVQTEAAMLWNAGAEQSVIRIRIADTGCGIPPENLGRIFDPFFTTKSPDKGTGLGLCVSYSIVSMYHGTIDVESQVGQGTTVIVTLPVNEPAGEDCATPTATGAGGGD